jgi:hypothetical protein
VDNLLAFNGFESRVCDMSLIENNWKWWLAVMILGYVAIHLDFFREFEVLTLAVILAKLVEVQSYHLDK